MTSPKHARDSEQGRKYLIPNRGEMDSVTSILNIISKPMLYNAYAKRAGERAVKQENEWHAIQEEEAEKHWRAWGKKHPDDDPPLATEKQWREKADDAAAKWIARAMRDYSADRMTLGSAVHWLCENHGDHNQDVLGKLNWFIAQMSDDWSKHQKACFNHYEQYVKFLENEGFRVVTKERTVFSELYGYAGTLDMIAEKDGKLYVGDIKTGFVSNTVALQLAAYRYASHLLDDDGVVTPFEYPIEGGFVLALKPKSYKVHRVECGEESFAAFLDAKRLGEWNRKDVVALWGSDGD